MQYNSLASLFNEKSAKERMIPQASDSKLVR
jgi:hypothetical protein